MIGAILRDLRGLGAFLARNARAVVLVSAATAILVAAPEYAFGERHYGAFLYFGVLPLVIALCLGLRPRALGLGIGSVRGWLPLTLFYLSVAMPFAVDREPAGECPKPLRLTALRSAWVTVYDLRLHDRMEAFVLGLSAVRPEGSARRERDSAPDAPSR
jgi:hypothetical protein